MDNRNVRIIETRRDFENLFKNRLFEILEDWKDFKYTQKQECMDKCKNYRQDGMCHYYRCPVLFNLDNIFDYQETIQRDKY